MAQWVYRPILRGVMRHRVAMIGVAVAALGAGVILARGLGSEFVPRLSEGAIVVNHLSRSLWPACALKPPSERMVARTAIFSP